jgi:hypothetical protein
LAAEESAANDAIATAVFDVDQACPVDHDPAVIAAPGPFPGASTATPSLAPVEDSNVATAAANALSKEVWAAGDWVATGRVATGGVATGGVATAEAESAGGDGTSAEVLADEVAVGPKDDGQTDAEGRRTLGAAEEWSAPADAVGAPG